jgi:hypothetical protein
VHGAARENYWGEARPAWLEQSEAEMDYRKEKQPRPAHFLRRRAGDEQRQIRDRICRRR